MILIDTGAFYALVDRNDINHEKAKSFYKDIIEKDFICTSLPILTETWLLIDARLGSYFADKFMLSIAKGIIEILDIEQEDINKALDIEIKYKEAGFGFVDTTCFALCEKYKIKKVFTFDKRHFSIYKPDFTGSLELYPF